MSAQLTDRAKRTILGSITDVVIGPARTLIVLVVVMGIFAILAPSFLSVVNLNNLFLQVAAVATISMGVVMVLLLGEIDLSVGSVSGLAGSITAVLVTQENWNPLLGMGVALLAGVMIGFVQGVIVTFLQLPSFIITLAGLLTWQGVHLAILVATGTINITDAVVVGLTGAFIPNLVAIGIAVLSVAAFTVFLITKPRRRRKAGLSSPPLRTSLIIPVTGLIVLEAMLLVIFFADRGVSLVVLFVVGIAVLMNVILTSTPYGQHLFAVGGNSDAAERAGIRVRGIRVSAFVMASTFASLGGILAASRLQAATQNDGGSDLLLLAIAGPVIAGVSLFGGRGTIWAALLGALIIGAISNGMDLLSVSSQNKYIVTGVVLVAAVAIDALARMSRRRRGLVV